MADLSKEWEEATPIKSEWEEATPIPPEKPKSNILSRLASGFLSDVLGLYGPNPEEVVKSYQATKEQPLRALRESMQPLVETITHPTGVPGRMLESAIEHPLMTGLMLTPLAGKALKGLAETQLPEKLYQSSARFKLDPHIIRTQGVDAAIKERAARIKLGLEKRVRMTEAGLKKAETLEKETRANIDRVIQNATERAEEVDLVKMVDEGLRNAYEVAERSEAPDQARRIVDKYRNEFLQVDKETGLPQRTTISVEEAQRIKRDLWEVSRFTGKTPSGLTAELKELERKGIAHRIMTELEENNPELKTLNPEDAARIDLRNQVLAHVNAATEGLPHAAIIMHPGKLGMYASIRAKTWGHPRIRESLAFALDRARSVARVSEASLRTSLDPEVITGEAAPIEAEIVPRRALPPPAVPPGGAMPPSGYRAPGGPPIYPPQKLLPEQITRETRYPPYFSERPFMGEPSAPPGPMESGVTPRDLLLSKSGGEFSSSYHPTPDRLEVALRKQPFLRTAEDNLVIQEARKINPRVGIPQEALIKRRTDVVEGEAFVPKDKIKFGSKGGVIGRPRKTEKDVARAIEEESETGRVK